MSPYLVLYKNGQDEELAAEALAEARAHAERDEHEAAIAAYRAAFERDPKLAALYAHELGHQYTWADRPAEALEWYRHRLAHAPTDVEAILGLARALSWLDRTVEAQQEYERVLEIEPASLDAQRGIARMLAWRDQLGASRARYEAILTEHPDDLESRLEHAQVVNWSGRHAEAIDLYQGILHDHPEDRSATLGLAQAQRWGGHPRAALQTLDPLASDSAARPILRELRRSVAPVIEGRSTLSNDSDDLTIFSTQFSWEGSGPRQVRLRSTLEQLLFTQTGQPDITGLGLGGGGSRKLGSRWTWNSYLRLLHFDSDDSLQQVGSGENLDFYLLGYDWWLSYVPSGRLRLDLSSDRSYVDTSRSLGFETSVTSVGLSADLRLRPRLVLSALAKQSYYSDENWRRLGRLSFSAEHGRAWTLRGEASVTLFNFRDTLDRGYWNPKEFSQLALSISAERSSPRARLLPRLELSVARESDDGDGYGVFAYQAASRVLLGERWELEAAVGGSDSRLSSRGGFSRDAGMLLLRWRY